MPEAATGIRSLAGSMAPGAQDGDTMTRLREPVAGARRPRHLPNESREFNMAPERTCLRASPSLLDRRRRIVAAAAELFAGEGSATRPGDAGRAVLQRELREVRGAIAGMIRDGVASGAFRSVEPELAAMADLLLAGLAQREPAGPVSRS